MSADEGTISAAGAVLPSGVVGPVAIEFRDGVITAIRPGSEAEFDGLLTPGFVDLQVNGLDAIDVPTASVDDLLDLSRRLAREGVAAWLPTVVTRPLGSYGDVLTTLVEAIGVQARSPEPGAAMLGVHLEGPFLGERNGAHRRGDIVAVDLGFIASLPEAVRLVTLAPECAGAVEATRVLSQRGVVVSIGHTGASVDQLDAAHLAGAGLVTHLFNAMTGVHHRDDGVAAWALTTDSIDVSVIGDLGHVSARALGLALRAKGSESLVVVSDSVAHLKPGLVGGGDGTPARLPDGTIAGATSTLGGCAVNLRSIGVTPETIASLTAANASRVLGETGRGVIGLGARADLAALDDAGRVVDSWIGGHRVAR